MTPHASATDLYEMRGDVIVLHVRARERHLQGACVRMNRSRLTKEAVPA
jgi:hypothetical protein